MSEAEPSQDEELGWVNGLNAETGEYLIPPLPAEAVCALAVGHPLDPEMIAALQAVYRPEDERYLRITYGFDANDLAEAGWGAVFARDTPPEVIAALEPLLRLREQQAGSRYRLYGGEHAYAPGESPSQFRNRLGRGPGPVHPDVVPYYLLLVGGPDVIPFEVQTLLDVAHAVGRVSFDTPEEYAAYAATVVAAEERGCSRARSLGFFAPRNPLDQPTQRSSGRLVRPLVDRLRAAHPDWHVEERIGEAAVKAELARMLGGDLTPAFFLSATHGAGFSPGHPLQRDHQGALVCQEWPGPYTGPAVIPPDQYFAADDLVEHADLTGTLAFFFACYGAGTPEYDEFGTTAGEDSRIAPSPFVARLAQALLVRGALAVVGHVDLAWDSSFYWPPAGSQIEVFDAMAKAVLDGQPIGLAMEYFNDRSGEVSAELLFEMHQHRRGKQNQAAVAAMFTATQDAKNYVVIGDPAVRLTFRG